MFMPLLFTFISGLFIILGAVISSVTKNNNKFVQFSIGMALGVMVTLIIFELFPEASEVLCEIYGNLKGYLLLLLLVIIGIIILKSLDLFVPDHCHGHDEEMDNDNLYHIGIVSSIALILHNLIEGMAIYGASASSVDMGIMLTLGVGFHNIPMGIVLSTTLKTTSKGKKNLFGILFIVAMSTLFGGIAMAFLSTYITETFLGILLGITLGMLLYIILFELLHEISHLKDKKISFLGVVTGVCILLISLFLE